MLPYFIIHIFWYVYYEAIDKIIYFVTIFSIRDNATRDAIRFQKMCISFWKDIFDMFYA